MTRSKAVIALEKEICEGLGPILDALRARLSNSCKRTEKDKFGNSVFVDGEIFSEKELRCFLDAASFRIATIGPLTKEQFKAFSYQGALVAALAAKALQERGREFTISDGGMHFAPPPVSELLCQQYELELATLNQMYAEQKQ